MNALETLSDIGNGIIEIVQLILDALVSVYEALDEFYHMLKDFNDTIIAMTRDPSANTGLPVVEAIGVFRYLVGDVAFYAIYIAILIGCLFTIYKLVCLIMEAYHALKEQVAAGSYSGGHLAGLFTKLFK